MLQAVQSTLLPLFCAPPSPYFKSFWTSRTRLILDEAKRGDLGPGSSLEVEMIEHFLLPYRQLSERLYQIIWGSINNVQHMPTLVSHSDMD